MRLFILPILYRKQEKIVVCDSFQGIKNRQPHIRLPAIAIIVNAINQNLPGAPAAKSAFDKVRCKDKVHQRRVSSFAKSEFVLSLFPTGNFLFVHQVNTDVPDS